MLIKVIGISLVAVGLSSAGFVYASYSKKRLHAMESALTAVGLLKGQVTHLLLPLSIAVISLASQNKMLLSLADAGCPMGGLELEKALINFGLGKPECECIANLFAAIPSLAAGQTGAFDAASEQLTAMIAQQSKSVQQGGTLYPKLGLLAGFTAFLLLI